MAVRGDASVLRPTVPDQVADAFAAVSANGASLALRGSGCSYGDAAMNSGGKVLDLSSMNSILSFDQENGIMQVEPGVTIRQLWRRAIPFGWWPPVVSGTMHVSCGGAAAMNIHGKNNFAVGTFGEHIQQFTLVTPAGETLRCSREENSDVFHAAIGGFGMLGCCVNLTIKLKKVHSGRMRVHAIPANDLDENLAYIEGNKPYADYLVGWLDCHARGKGLGRGLLHRGDQLARGEDPEGERMLSPRMQDVPTRLFHLVPKGWLWPGMWCVSKGGLISKLNWAKFKAGFREANASPYLQTHGGFHFLLDYVPNWKKAFLPGGLIQFQPFVPAGEAARVFQTILEACQKEKLVSYLGVLKRHRPDPFLMTHAVDGFSLALDFAVTRGNRESLWELCRRLADVVLAAGGRFYYAKDAVLEASSFPRIHGAEAVKQFRALKERLDPKNVLQTDLARRMGVV